VFVDVGVADGLVHRSEITWDKGVEPTTLHKAGDPVRVKVVGIDRERQRISLSIKQLAEDPWARAVRELRLGETVQATITRVMPYGAFARSGPGIEGLVHVSEIAAHRIATPGQVGHLRDPGRGRRVSLDAHRAGVP